MTYEIPGSEGEHSDASPLQRLSILGLFVRGTYEGVEYNLHGDMRVEFYEDGLKQQMAETCSRETGFMPGYIAGGSVDILVTVPQQVHDPRYVSVVLGPDGLDKDEAARIGALMREEISPILATAPPNPATFLPFTDDMLPRQQA